MPEDESKASVAFWKRKLQPILHAVLSSNDSPRQFAAGVALGAFLAFTPTVGIQTVMALALATALKVSRIPAAAMVYITNPLTIAPIYWTCYLVGVYVCRLVGFDVVSIGEFVGAFRVAHDAGGLKAAAEFMRILGHYGAQMAIPLLVGCFILGLAAAAVCYPIALRIIEGHRVVHAQKVARKLQKKSRGAEEDEADFEVEEIAAAPEETKEPDHDTQRPESGGAGADTLDPASKADAEGSDRRAG